MINRIPKVLLLWIIFFFFTQIVYVLIDQYWALDHNKLKMYLKLCTLEDKIRYNSILYREDFNIWGKSSSLIGAYIGVCVDAIYLGGTPQNINKTGSLFKAVMRVILLITILYPIYWLFFIYLKELFTN